MQLFIDTANLDDIRRWQAFGLVEGATTNPALLAKEGNDPLDQLGQVAEIVAGPVSAQVTHTAVDAMIAQGEALSRVAPNIVVKVPNTADGFQAARALTAKGVACNATLTFQPAQAIAFARVPVAYVSLIVGRVEDFGLSSIDEIRQTRELLDRLGTPTRLLVASMRNPAHLAAAIVGGADVVTVPPTTWESIYQNPMSHQGQSDFFAAWRRLPDELRRRYESLGLE